MHNKRVAGVKLDRLAVSREASHQIGSSSNRQRPTRKTISELKGEYDIFEALNPFFEVVMEGYADSLMATIISTRLPKTHSFRHRHVLSVSRTIARKYITRVQE